MIVKMQFVNITGPQEDIDRVMEQYLSRYEIQLEPALSELKTTENLRPFVEKNPYKDALLKTQEFIRYLEHPDQITPDPALNKKAIFSRVHEIDLAYRELEEKKKSLLSRREDLTKRLKLLDPFRPLDCDLSQALHFRYIKHRFGRIPIEYYHKIEDYLMDDISAIFLEGKQDDNYVYGVYFAAATDTRKIDTVFRTLHFERIAFPEDVTGSPEYNCRDLEYHIRKLNKQLEALEQRTIEMLTKRGPELLSILNQLQTLSHNFDVRKLAACVEDKRGNSYLLCGWMSEENVQRFLKDSANDEKVFVVVEDDVDKYFGEPPTQLKNPKLFKPFEMFIRMYGMPAHNELDPTIFVGITYAFIFGVMFGDAGQGLCLLIGGGLLYHFKKIPLAGIISIAGIFSTIFGFLFGSVFGFEDILPALWLRPINHMTTLPFIGKLNTIFIVAVAFGMFIILLAMILHIINALKSKDPGNTWFDPNGVAGLIFYGAAVLVIFLFMTGHKLPAAILLTVLFVLPLLLILFKEPLTRKLTHQKAAEKEGIGMFLVQGFFELFETLLSYFSNTLSFVRIGAFAVSHAAMMEVVLMLSGAEAGSPNWVIVVLGNLFVCGMEGLVVGIQVLRLEYYEMFSRFYKGTGREFKPY